MSGYSNRYSYFHYKLVKKIITSLRLEKQVSIFLSSVILNFFCSRTNLIPYLELLIITWKCSLNSSKPFIML